MSQDKRLSLKVKSSFVKMVQLTLQGGGNSYTKELSDGSNSWQEYIFNFSDILNNSVDITQALLIAPEKQISVIIFIMMTWLC